MSDYGKTSRRLSGFEPFKLDEDLCVGQICPISQQPIPAGVFAIRLENENQCYRADLLYQYFERQIQDARQRIRTELLELITNNDYNIITSLNRRFQEMLVEEYNIPDTIASYISFRPNFQVDDERIMMNVRRDSDLLAQYGILTPLRNNYTQNDVRKLERYFRNNLEIVVPRRGGTGKYTRRYKRKHNKNTKRNVYL